MFCVKLIDKKGKEHLVLVLDKYAEIDFKDGSRVIKYESGGKTSMFFGKDVLNKFEYNTKGPKVVGIDCTTGESFIMDLNIFDLTYAKSCGVNEIIESGLYSNLPKAYYTIDEEDDPFGLLPVKFIKSIRSTLNLKYIDLMTDRNNDKASKHRVELGKLPLVLEKYAFINTQYLDPNGEWKDDTLQVVTGEVGGLIKFKNDLHEYFYIY